MRRTRSLAIGAALVGAVLLVGCGDAGRFGAPEPATEQGESILVLYQGFFLTALAVGVLVWGLLVYVLLRFRRRNDDVPRQNPYNIPIEITYTITPLLIVAALFAFSWRTEVDVSEVGDQPDVSLRIVGFQWQWQFSYLDENGEVEAELIGDGTGDPPELVLPVDSTIQFDLVANDVNHSFWVPEFLEKRDLIPGIENVIEVDTTREGTYEGRCAEFCGLDHWRMQFSVRIVPQAEYDTWLAEQGDLLDEEATGP